MKKIKEKDIALKQEITIRRFIAFIIDWYLASLLAGVPVLFIYAMTTGNDGVVTVLTALPFTQAMIAGTIAIITSTAYYVLIPTYVFRGQTLGKKAMGIKVLCDDNSEITLKTVLKREVLGVMLVEGGIVAGSGYLRQMIGIAISPTIYTVLTVVSSIITIISIAMIYVSRDKRMIHELISKTRIVKA